MELNKPKAILFDWDNTLVDTWPVIYEALNKTFTAMGHEPWSLDLVKQRVARSMRDSFPDIFGPDWQKAGEIYQANFRAIHLERLTPLEGAESMLAFLRKQPVYMAVVSNKKGVNLRKEVEHIQWGRYFDKVVGADDTPRDKPFPEPVLSALKGSPVEAGPDVWFIGDSAVDMECAQATGCTPVWYGELPEKLMYPFRRRFTSHTELTKALALIFKDIAA
jgi:phosphoglycolate phosphatase